MAKCLFYFVLMGIMAVMSGCSPIMLPVAKNETEGRWKNFEQAKAAFDKIIPYETSTKELSQLQFDPFSNANIEILTYLDLIKLFIPNASVTMGDVDESIRDCISVQEECLAYEMSVFKLKNQRYGNVFLDLFKFKRKSHQTGWVFSALIVMKNDLVVYKMWKGTPQIDKSFYRKNPLGPLQEPAEMTEEATAITIL